MTHVTFSEYQEAKNEIILGIEYKESSTLEGNTIHKTYSTENNGIFYEVNNDGRIEFWSDKHPDSRIYDESHKDDGTEQVRVCIDYRMAKGQWDIAENCIVTSIAKKAYREITEEFKYNCWSMNMESEAGQKVATMIRALAKLQGYNRVDSWSICLDK